MGRIFIPSKKKSLNQSNREGREGENGLAILMFQKRWKRVFLRRFQKEEKKAPRVTLGQGRGKAGGFLQKTAGVHGKSRKGKKTKKQGWAIVVSNLRRGGFRGPCRRRRIGGKSPLGVPKVKEGGKGGGAFLLRRKFMEKKKGRKDVPGTLMK